MYLKNLTVLGFKSFAEKTSLNFQPGVTAIVGPNGCGKSNVSDAIRWVLGEQSAKALRGGEMADVIFNGTDSRKPLAMAEVSLTIGGIDDDQLRASGVEVTYNEVTLTRRVFRDGGSEYFINKVACRLKDIQQLFMGTGVGRTSYSIMAQGNITQILSSKPEERRMVFEEAAGITRFKAQKKEAMRKLESTDQNLLRVADLLREVKRQIGSLQRQAGKARRYKQFAAELQHLDTQLARHDFDVLQAARKEREEQIARLRSEIEVCSERVLIDEDKIRQLREHMTQLEQEIQNSKQKGHELKSEIERHQARIHHNRERMGEWREQHDRSLADAEASDQNASQVAQEIVVVGERLEKSTASLQGQRVELEARKQTVQGFEQQLREKLEALRKTQNEAFQASQQLARVRNQINSLDLQKQGNAIRLEKLSSEKIGLEEETTRLDIRLKEFAQNVEADKLNVQTQQGSLEQRKVRLQQLHGSIREATQRLDDLLRQQAEKRSRLLLLEQLQADYEGFGSGASTILKGTQSVLGSLADRIKVPAEYIAAIETALGHYLQLVLTEKPETAQKLISELAQNRKGKASIAALDFLPRADSGMPAPDGSLTLPCPALNVVEAEPLVRSLLERLLGQTRIVKSLEDAVTERQTNGGEFDFVTLTGEILTRDGIFTGGASQNGKQAGSLLGRKNQIEELQRQLASVQEQIAEASRAKGALHSQQTELEAGLQQAQASIRNHEVAIATQQGEFKALQNSRSLLRQKFESASHEINSLTAGESEGIARRNALAAQLAGFETQEQSLQTSAAELNSGLDALRHDRDAANNVVTEAKVALAAEEQVWNSLSQQQRPLQQRLQELKRLAEQRRNDAANFIQRLQSGEKEIVESEQKSEALEHLRAQESSITADLLSQKEGREGEIQGEEERLRGERTRLHTLQENRGTLEVELAQKTMASQNLHERIQQKYQINLDDVRSECITITMAEEGAARVQTLTPEEMAANGISTDWKMVAEQVAGLQKRIDEMGPVNLVAIEEYEETEQRHQFLTAQNDDLVRAKEQLLEVINRINVQTREMFTETFTKIRDNFRLMFSEIFGGGKADLILVEEGDVLESGIDIVARPPGKQLQNISLLSGGEQTMTAVALLFSIYQVKPSPFCVLDELDAPLDESNINRFIKILQRFLEHSQFVIITHNKRTISMADVLYGVTMQEHGVSRIVSVKFHKAGESTTPEQSSHALEASGTSASQAAIEPPEIVMAK